MAEQVKAYNIWLYSHIQIETVSIQQQDGGRTFCLKHNMMTYITKSYLNLPTSLSI